MDLRSRIRRRQHSGNDAQLILDYDAVNPAVHVEEPTGRGPVPEQLLDYTDPIFHGQLPSHAYVWGPSGSGKSAVITALLTQLDRLLCRSRTAIHTTTRARPDGTPAFVYVDARRARSDFGLYQTILDSVLEESVPEHGVGVDAISSWLSEHLEPRENRVLVAVDHVGEPDTYSLSELAGTLSPLNDSLSWIAVGRSPPDDLPEIPPEHIEIPAYDDHVLVDILTERASDGLSQRAVTHEQLRRIVRWGEGNAHNALAALLSAASVAVAHNRSRVIDEDIQTGMDAVPRPSVSLARVLCLSQNRQSVLRQLVDLDDTERASVDTTTETIAQTSGVNLSEATVKRFLYELAETGIIERVTNDTSPGIGRPPSRLEPRFPTLVFRQLYDLPS
ncbi:Cdc6/Cdc18 family protein [Halocatena marina]|uniref:Cdc6/Cdc18 family protein n=1 Tax=Halocatena marina TaxID=2934937 RepID=UPI003616EAB3